LKFMRDEFYHPLISDRKERTAWQDAGALDARERARLVAKKILAEHRPLKIPPDCEARIRKKFEIKYDSL